MTRTLNYIFSVIILYVNLSHGTIVKMEEFYNSELNQTLIFMHDYHWNLPECDAKQSKDAIEIISELYAPLIIEGSDSEEVKERTISAIIAMGMDKEEAMSIVMKPKLLDILMEEGKNKKVKVTSAEFRTYDALYFSGLQQIISNCDRGVKYDEVIAAYQKPEMTEGYGQLFYYRNIENENRMYDFLYPYFDAIFFAKEKTNIDNCYVNAFSALSKQAMDEWHAIATLSNLYNGKSFQDLGSFVVNDMIAKDTDDSCYVRAESLYCRMETVTTFAFDASILKTLHENRHARVVFVHAGDDHVEALAKTCLPIISFNSKNVISNIGNAKKLCEVAYDPKFTKELEKCAVDVKSFLNQCKTLPKLNNELKKGCLALIYDYVHSFF